MRTIQFIVVSTLVAFTMIGFISASDKEPKIDGDKLVGKWILKDRQVGNLIIEFKKEGKARATGVVQGTEFKAEGVYSLEGNKLTLTWKVSGKEEKTVRTISKLTDTEFVSKDDKEKNVDTMLRLTDEGAKTAAQVKELEWKVDSTGTLPKSKGMYYTVFRVIKPGEVLVLPTKRAATVGGGTQEVDDGPPILVKGIVTAGLKVAALIEVDGTFNVTGEHILKGAEYKGYDGSSVWVVELQK